MIWLLAGSLLPSLSVAWLAGFIVRRRSAERGFVARPGGHSTHTQATPLGGGLAIWLGVVLPLAVGDAILHDIVVSPTPDRVNYWLGTGSLRAFVEPHLGGLIAQNNRMWFLLLAATGMMLLGLWDDKRRLDWRLRLGAETAVAVVTVAAGWRLSLFIDAPWLTGALSVLWIVALVNAFNMLDNMDGLSAGVAAIAAAMLAAVILTAPKSVSHGPQLFVGGLLLVLVGSLLGFLWHNRPPARLFMGDAGSYLVGYLMATATISATFAGPGLPRHAILAPLCVLAVPIYDMLTVIWIRVRSGRSPFEGDRNHVSHRLVDLGLSRAQAVLVIYAATALCGFGAFALHYVNLWGAAAVLTLVAAILVALAIVDLRSRSSTLRHQDANSQRRATED